MVEMIQYINGLLDQMIPQIPCIKLSNKKIHLLAHEISKEFMLSEKSKTEQNAYIFTKCYLRNHLIAKMMQNSSVLNQFMEPFFPIYTKINSSLRLQDNFRNLYYFWEAIFNGVLAYSDTKSLEDTISYFYHSYVLDILNVNEDYLEYFKKLYYTVYSKSIVEPRTFTNCYKIGFYNVFLGYDKKLIRKIVERYKIVNPRYYQVIMKRHGKKLNEWNVLSVKENQIYHNALASIEKVLNRDVENWLQTSVGKTLYLRHPQDNPAVIDDIVSFYSSFFPKRYHVLLKRHGKSFLEWNSMTPEENTDYVIANNDIDRLQSIRREHFDEMKIFCKETFKQDPMIISIIKKKQQGMKVSKIALEYQISVERVYEILAQNILLFGYKATHIIYEILVSSSKGIEYLKASQQFNYFIRLPWYRSIQLIPLLRYMLRNYPEIQERAEEELKHLLHVQRFNEDYAKRYAVDIKTEKKPVKKETDKKKMKDMLIDSSFFDNFPGEDPILITRIVERFKVIRPNYYDIIVKRHGESLLKWNPLNQPDNAKYNNAFKAVQGYLLRTDLENWLNDSLFTRMSHVSPKVIQGMMPNYRLLKPQHYNSIVKRHNEDFLSWNNISDNTLALNYALAMKYFNSAFPKIEQDIPKFQALLKESLLEQKDMICFIRDKRKGLSTEDISMKYHIDTEKIYEVYAKCLFAFGYDCIPLIQEILTNSQHGMEYLHQSTHFKAMIDGRYLSKLNVLDVPKYMFPNNVDYQEYLQQELRKYYPISKKRKIA